MNNPSNKQKIAIVTVGYNRLNSIKRLLQSLTEAHYDVDDVPLVISIDASGNEDLYDYVRNYKWVHGQKYVIIHENRLGLREHIFSCGDLTQYFKGIVLLEDDLLVSPYFYQYVCETMDYYENDSLAACVGLYTYHSNIFAALPFEAYQEDFDVFATQTTITWGQAWNTRMWTEFREWMKRNPEIHWKALDIAQNIKNFTRAWSKFFSAYLNVSGKFVVVPYKSYTTNYSDAGEHSFYSIPVAQVPIVRRKENLIYAPIAKLIKYDSFFAPVDIFDQLPVPSDDVYIDLYGNRPNFLNKRYLVSVDILPYKIIKSYGLTMRPIDANIRLNTPGTGIYIYDLHISEKRKTDIQPIRSIEYRLVMFRPALLAKYVKDYTIKHLRKKFHL